jgi:hypothetical protein
MQIPEETIPRLHFDQDRDVTPADWRAIEDTFKGALSKNDLLIPAWIGSSLDVLDPKRVPKISRHELSACAGLMNAVDSAPFVLNFLRTRFDYVPTKEQFEALFDRVNDRKKTSNYSYLDAEILYALYARGISMVKTIEIAALQASLARSLDVDNYYNFASIAATLRLFGENSKITAQDWKKMRAQLNRHRDKTSDAGRFAYIASKMKILAADTVTITPSGVECTNRAKEKLEEKPMPPETLSL